MVLLCADRSAFSCVPPASHGRDCHACAPSLRTVEAPHAHSGSQIHLHKYPKAADRQADLPFLARSDDPRTPPPIRHGPPPAGDETTLWPSGSSFSTRTVGKVPLAGSLSEP